MKIKVSVEFDGELTVREREFIDGEGCDQAFGEIIADVSLSVLDFRSWQVGFVKHLLGEIYQHLEAEGNKELISQLEESVHPFGKRDLG